MAGMEWHDSSVGASQDAVDSPAAGEPPPAISFARCASSRVVRGFAVPPLSLVLLELASLARGARVAPCLWSPGGDGTGCGPQGSSCWGDEMARAMGFQH